MQLSKTNLENQFFLLLEKHVKIEAQMKPSVERIETGHSSFHYLFHISLMQQIELLIPSNCTFYTKELLGIILYKITHNALIALGFLHPHCA